MIKFVISLQARQDLDDIWFYIAKDSASNANKVEDAIVERLYLIAEHPSIGHVRVDVGDKSIRFFSVYDYLIGYRLKGDFVEIVRVVSGYRDVANEFSNQSEEEVMSEVYEEIKAYRKSKKIGEVLEKV